MPLVQDEYALETDWLAIGAFHKDLKLKRVEKGKTAKNKVFRGFRYKYIIFQ